MSAPGEKPATMETVLDAAAMFVLKVLEGIGIDDVSHVKIIVHRRSKPGTHSKYDLEVGPPIKRGA